MEQRFEGAQPHAAIRLEGRRVIRGDVTNDWGLGLQWEIRRNGHPRDALRFLGVSDFFF